MKYIKEYHIFSFLKNKENKEKKKKLFVNFNEEIILPGSEKILFYKTYINHTDLLPSKCVINNIPTIQYLLITPEEESLKSVNSYVFSESSLGTYGYKVVGFNLDELENDLNKSNLVEGVSVKIIDNNICGYITKIWTALFADHTFNSDIRKSLLSKVIEINGIDDKKYYRLSNQVKLTNDISELGLSETFEEEIKDYLTDIDESQKFNIVITKKIIDRIGIVNFMVEIKFKDGIKNNLDTISLFFRNINTLKKRINAINGYDFEIEDISKNGILLKIFNMKKFESSMSKGECDICGESIYTDDRICDDCKMNKDEIEFDNTVLHLEEPPQTLPAYTMSQNIYFESKEEITFKSVTYNDFEEWSENRTIEKFNKIEDKYIRDIFNSDLFECDICPPKI